MVRVPLGAPSAIAMVVGASLLPSGTPVEPWALIPVAGLLLLPRRWVPGWFVVLVGGALVGLVSADSGRPAAPTTPHATVVGRVVDWRPMERGARGTVDVLRWDGAPPPHDTRLRIRGAQLPPNPLGSVTALTGTVKSARGTTVPGGWAPSGIDGTLRVTETARFGPGSPPGARSELGARCDRVLGGFPGRLAGAVLLGRSDRLLPEERDAFRRSGTAHLVAVSGLHVGLVAVLVAVVAAPLGPRRAGVLAVAAAYGYAGLAGWSASATRAATMTAVVAMGRILRRSPPALDIVTVALAFLLAWRVSLIHEVGFRLSFGAVAGILAVRPILPSAGWKQFLLGPPVISLGAQLGTLPTSIVAFGSLAPFALLPNLIAVPLTGLFLPATALALLTEPVWGVGHTFAEAARVLGRVLQISIQAAQPLPVLESLPVPPASAQAVAWACLLLAACLPRTVLPRARWIWVLAVPGLLLAPWPPMPGPWVAFLDVSQGDAAVARLEDGSVWLFDAGDDRGPVHGGRHGVVPFLRWARVRTLTGVVISHRHRDHVGGLETVLDAYPVGRVLDAAIGSGETARRVSTTLDVHGLRAESWAPGDTVYQAGDSRLVWLHPSPHAEGDANNGSVVLLLELSGMRVLFTGDVERGGEAQCTVRIPRVDVLKVAHHGSGTSSTPAFLDAARPTVAVISCGEGNRYGHPDPEVLKRLGKRSIRVYRTDGVGSVLLRPDDDGWRTTTWAPRVRWSSP